MKTSEISFCVYHEGQDKKSLNELEVPEIGSHRSPTGRRLSMEGCRSRKKRPFATTVLNAGSEDDDDGALSPQEGPA
ncbi:hypothetical protein ANN_15374 [Periplaneta americana]|uniref:Uncharacterized protein n=1 Tax=Periplaneta americana TaxID=6978 RepID=A0ABQ8SHI7_PERAM|nr:hypothetical protein ANN_15374 [Periplaneta americana]